MEKRRLWRRSWAGSATTSVALGIGGFGIGGVPVFTLEREISSDRWLTLH
jgi:hypothetical protein